MLQRHTTASRRRRRSRTRSTRPYKAGGSREAQRLASKVQSVLLTSLKDWGKVVSFVAHPEDGGTPRSERFYREVVDVQRDMKRLIKAVSAAQSKL